VTEVIKVTTVLKVNEVQLAHPVQLVKKVSKATLVCEVNEDSQVHPDQEVLLVALAQLVWLALEANQALTAFKGQKVRKVTKVLGLWRKEPSDQLVNQVQEVTQVLMDLKALEVFLANKVWKVDKEKTVRSVA